jgi:hypothetical protein
MNIAWSSFTPWSALGGGLLIGMAATLLILINGRIAGVSGIVNGLIQSQSRSGWQIAFVVGLLAAPWLLHGFLPGVGNPSAIWSMQAWPLLLLAGFLVGFGARLANGCTSGHGVCGLARLSIRSLWAVLTFLGAGFTTVFFVRHILGGGL